MTRDGNILYFDTDDEFEDFCINKNIVIRQGKHCMYTDLDYNPMYLEEVNKGTRFIIKDENSLICKHQCVSYRTITKQVDNLDEYKTY